MKKKFVISSIIVLLIFTSILSYQASSNTTSTINDIVISSYVDATPILIQNDNDFYNFPEISGDGSPSTPFVIQNLNITNVGGYGISISDVTAYWEIRDCYIKADQPIILDFIYNQSSIINNTLENANYDGNAIAVINTAAGIIIQENYIHKCIFGIYVEDSSNFQIDNNYFYENDFSIWGGHFTSSVIEHNTFEKNQQMTFTSCSNLDFFNNTFKENEYGLQLSSVDFTNIIDNVFIDNWDYGVEFQLGGDSVIYRNYFIRNAVYYLSQAYDESHTSGNEWYYDGVGNFWSDLGDGKVYAIDGSDDVLDLYPFYNSDSDSLNDYEEDKVYLTDKYDEDTDDDEMPDDYEVENLLNPLVDDAFEDPDTDLLTNIQEFWEMTNPHLWDSDSDLLPDGYEAYNGLNPLIPDAGKDLDGDGLTNWEEYSLGTMPNKVDSDSDGMEDKWEDDNGLDPLTNDAYADPDEDLLNNFLEFIYDCDPFLNDTDGDSHIDSWEIAHGTDPNNALDFPDEIFNTNTEESPFSFAYVILTLIALSGFLISRRKR